LNRNKTILAKAGDLVGRQSERWMHAVL